MYCIYCITNIKNNKKYIGYTKDLKTRWYKHQFHGNRGDGSCTQLYKSMKKHGIDNFKIEIIEDNIQTEIEAKNREIFFINEYNTFVSGYNATIGGTGGDMSDYESWRNALKISHQNRSKDSYASYGMSGKNHKKETIEKQSIARKSYWDNLSLNERESRGKKISGKNNGMFGKSPKNSLRIKYNDTIYNSITEASRKTGYSTKFLKKHGEIYYECFEV